MTENLPAEYDPNFTGLEDFDKDDAVIPRLKIMHKDGEFKDNLSGATFKKLKLIILAMNKGRILWHPSVEDGDKPMCRSSDFNLGFPTSKEDATKGKEFPWHLTNFTQEEAQPDPNTGEVILECARCPLKDWGSHPLGKLPYCAEQWTLSVYYDGIDENGNSSGTWTIALLTLQKSGLKAIKAYLTSFQRAKQPAFTAICEVGLDLQGKGDVVYSTPKFRSIGTSDKAKWQEYGLEAHRMRTMLKRLPEPLDDGDGAPQNSDNSYNPPPSNTTVVQEAPAQAPNDPWASAAQQTEQAANPAADPWASTTPDEEAAKQAAAADQARQQAHQAPPAPPVEQPSQPEPPKSNTGLPF